MNDEDGRWKNDPQYRYYALQLIKTTKRTVRFRTSNKD